MTSIRICISTIPSLLKQSNSFVRLGQQQFTRLQHTRNVFLAPVQSVFTCTLQNRNFFKIKDQSKDDVPEGRQRIYYGLLTPQIRTVKWFSLTTSILGVISQPFLYRELSALENLPLLIAGCSFVGLFTFVTPFMLHFVTKKYVTHLDYDTEKDTYIASTVNFFCMLKETEFKPEEVKVPEIPGMFTTFHAKGKALFLEARLFEDPGHYARIMGYDKPMDFKLYDTSKVEEDPGKKNN